MAILSSLTSVVAAAGTIALITIGAHWIVSAKGPQLPKSRAGANIYGMKWQWKGVSIIGGMMFLTFSIDSARNLTSTGDWFPFALFGAMAILSVWLVIGGPIVTNEIGLAKKGVWRTMTIPWNEITEIKLHKRDGGAIEVRAGSRKLIIDVRFVARQHLLDELTTRTQLQPVGTLP